MCRSRLVAIVAATCLALALVAVPQESSAQFRVRIVASGLSQPVAFVQDPLDPTVQFIVQKGGRIRVLHAGSLEPVDFLDLSGQISTDSERGLLGLAFPPDAATSRRLFVNFTNPDGHTVIARFKRSLSDPLQVDPSTRFDLQWPGGSRYITQPFANHNGGTMHFGPDGYLYIGLGDGGGSNDPNHLAQSPSSLLGKMLRMDVSVNDSDPVGYRVPNNNPFVGSDGIGALDEIWAFGLRNPWKFSFDMPSRGGTGGMFIGDVGQAAREEIDFEPAGAGGRNYGWRNFEGTLPGEAGPVPPLAYPPATPPIYEYPRTVGRSVTGGYVYRGSELAGVLGGRYVFGDFMTNRVFSLGLTYDGSGEASVADVQEHTQALGGDAQLGPIVSIDIDAAGELYITSIAGIVRRIEAADPPSLDPIAGKLTIGAPNTLTGTDFTAGTVIKLFVATASGALSFGPYTPTAWTPTSLTFAIPSNVPLGNGFGSVQAINTDEGYTQSNVVGALLEGDATDNIPTILFIDGDPLAAPAPGISTAHVDTVLSQGATVAITGTGFNSALVNLFTSTGNSGPLVPLAGATQTQLQVNIPTGAPTGPATLQVVNSPYTGNVQSNAVAVVLGAALTITGVSVSGPTVTVTGTGFSTLSVVNLFNLQGGLVVNLGGLNGATPNIPLTVTSDTQLSFSVPAGAVAGPAYVQVLNPPFIPFSSSGNDPDGAFTLVLP